MTRAASRVMADFKDIVLAYGQSDEYSFIFRRDTTIYSRRQRLVEVECLFKINVLTNVVVQAEPLLRLPPLPSRYRLSNLSHPLKVSTNLHHLSKATSRGIISLRPIFGVNLMLHKR